jgi:hypothetical protein
MSCDLKAKGGAAGPDDLTRRIKLAAIDIGVDITYFLPIEIGCFFLR